MLRIKQNANTHSIATHACYRNTSISRQSICNRAILSPMKKRVRCRVRPSRGSYTPRALEDKHRIIHRDYSWQNNAEAISHVSPCIPSSSLAKEIDAGTTERCLAYAPDPLPAGQLYASGYGTQFTVLSESVCSGLRIAVFPSNVHEPSVRSEHRRLTYSISDKREDTVLECYLRLEAVSSLQMLSAVIL